jgi:hypothetical protein
MSMSSQTARFAAAAALAAALVASPAAAAPPPSPLARGWQQLVDLLGRQGLGLDPNGWKLRSRSQPRGADGASGAVRTAVARSVAAPR